MRSLRCPECGAARPVDARFCGSCGARLSPSAKPIPKVGRSRPGGLVRKGWLIAAVVLFAALLSQIATSDRGRVGDVALPDMPQGSTARQSQAPESETPSASELPARGPLPVGWHVHDGPEGTLFVPPSWDVSSETIAEDFYAPRRILVVASFDPEAASPTGNEDWECAPIFPIEKVLATGPRQVLIAISASPIARTLLPPPTAYGNVNVDEERRERVRLRHSETPGFCGNERVLAYPNVIGAGGDAHLVWIFVGENATRDLLEQAVAVINSFRPPPRGHDEAEGRSRNGSTR